MNDLEPISVLQRALRPISTRHDVSIELNGYAIAFRGQAIDKRSDIVGCDVFLSSIDDEFHHLRIYHRCTSALNTHKKKPSIVGRLISDVALADV